MIASSIFSMLYLFPIYNAEINITLAHKKHKIHKECSDIVHIIQKIINENPGKSICCIAREINMDQFARSSLKILDTDHMFSEGYSLR